MIKIEMCNHNSCLKSYDCYRFLGTISNPEMHSYRKFQNLCGQSNNYKWQWFGGVKELKEQLIKEGKLVEIKEIPETIQNNKLENEVTEETNENENLERND